MNGIYYQDPLAKEKESYDEFDDEAVGTTAEFINPLGGILGSVSSSIGGLLGGGGRKQPVQVRDHRSSAPGVRDARLEVPGRGTANLRLPEEVVSKRAFDEATQNLQDGIGKVTGRLNTLEQNRLPELQKELGVVLANTRQAIANEMKARKKAMVRQSRALRSMQSTTMIMSLLSQQQQQRKLESHFHDAFGEQPNGSTAAPAALSGGDNNALLFLLPMMMGEGGMGGGGSEKEGDNGDSYGQSGSDNNMMTMMMMMTLLK
ncbi:MAG: hypothetical protein L0Z46_12560 [Nitrospiraceae bacterium]|nr:hypothetical protein [Nitrospiraceae bacterium]